MNSLAIFFQWETPDGPSLPFASGILVFDLIRILVITLSFSLGILGASAVLRPGGTLGQKARMASLGGIFLLTVASGTATHIGDYGHWRLVVSFFLAVVGTWGLWSYYKYEKPSEIKPYGGK